MRRNRAGLVMAAPRVVPVPPASGLVGALLLDDLPRLAEHARRAEENGWHGFFVWDHVQPGVGGEPEVFDPWIALALIADRTDSVRLGPIVTPLPRRRPWVVARQAATIDHLSGGRLTLGVGLGYPAHEEFTRFGEDPDLKQRAAKLDEGLAILRGLWSGEPFSFQAGQTFMRSNSCGTSASLEQAWRRSSSPARPTTVR